MSDDNKRVFAFDFDGVIASYDGYRGPQHVGDPQPDVVEVIKILKENGHKVLIYSTRGDRVLKNYCKEHSIPVDYFNRNPEKEGENAGKPIASVYVDDRAVLYKGQSPNELVKELLEFKPYWRQD